MTDSIRDREAWEIAANARRFALLARRHELQANDRESRSFHALTNDAPGALHALDAALTVGASDADLICGRIVALASGGGSLSAQLLDVLDAMPFDRLAAIYFALPIEQRSRLRGRVHWAARAEGLAARVSEEVRAIADLIDETPTSPIGHELARRELVLARL